MQEQLKELVAKYEEADENHTICVLSGEDGSVWINSKDMALAKIFKIIKKSTI